MLGNNGDRSTRVIKYTHACVRIEHAGGVLVVDPGVWSEPEALDGCTAVLLTHEHADHVDAVGVRGVGAPVFGPAGARIPGVDFEALMPGARFELDGLG